MHHLMITFSYLSRTSAHESAFLCPQTHPRIGPFPFLQFLNLLPWPHPGFCGHLDWLHLCSLNDLYSHYLSVQHSCRANESLYHSVPRHPFPLRYQHYPDFTLFYSKPELHGWTLQLLLFNNFNFCVFLLYQPQTIFISLSKTFTGRYFSRKTHNSVTCNLTNSLA